MARVTVEDCLEKVPNRFSLVVLVSKRAKQLIKGAALTSVQESGNMSVVNALREVAGGTVGFEHDPQGPTPQQQLEKYLNR